ncbi:MAG: histidine kinase dimerization/phospho-acceptor domain-containing protein, partial [Candidatus Saccharimonadales bacterium]
MDYLQNLTRKAKAIILILILLDNAVLFGGWWLGRHLLGLSTPLLIARVAILAIIEALALSLFSGAYLMQPLKSLWNTLTQLSPGETPNMTNADKLSFGRELVTHLVHRIYQIANVAEQAKVGVTKEMSDLSRNFIAQSLPLPFFVLDSSENIKFANQAAADYLGMPTIDLIGKNVYMELDMSFPSENTFDRWLNQAKASSATAGTSWERVRLNVRDNHPTHLFDLAAYYNRDNSDGNATLLVLFDHTKQYSQDDQAISYVALTVHELRAPLTLLRGYIEVMQEEFDGKVDPELQSFMDKMKVQADQLMAFVNNILNVARVDSDQLELKLEEADWT